MANTAIDSANSRRRADAGWTVAYHWICRTYCRVHRDVVDVDLDRAGRERESVDADGSLRRAGKRFLLDRMRDHGVVTCATPIPVWVAHASRGNQVVRQTGPPVLPYIESEFQDEPEREGLGQKRRVHLHGNVAM